MNNAAAAAVGASLVMILMFGAVAWVLTVIAYWKLFQKAGKPGWHSIVPFLNVYDEYDMCWNGIYGIVGLVALSIGYFITGSGSNGDTSNLSGPMAIVALALFAVYIVLKVIESNKLSKAFGHGIGYTLGLIFLPTLFMLILGFGSDQYQGRPE